MNSQPGRDDEGQETSGVPASHFTSATEIMNESTKAIKSLGSVYQEIGWAGFFAASAVVIAILTIVLAFLTGTGDEGKWYGGIAVWEEALFLALSAVFAAIGLIFLMKYNDRKADIQALTIEIERDRNRWLHEEALAKLRLPGSQSPMPPNLSETGQPRAQKYAVDEMQKG